MTLNEVLGEIITSGLQKDVYMALHSVVMKDYESMFDEMKEYSASINAIKKINKGKNSAIDALCEKETR